MTITIKTSSEDTIAIPASLLAELELREGDAVKVSVEGKSLRLARIDKFLQLRGALAEDAEFDRAMEEIQGGLDRWNKM